MFEVFLGKKLVISECAQNEGAMFLELCGSSQWKNGKVPVSSVPICFSLLEDDLDIDLTWVALL